TDRVTLRDESFDQRTGELAETNDESVRLGPGSGLTDDESALHDDSNDRITLTIWGPTDSLEVSAEPDELPWLRQQVHDWLQRQVFAKQESNAHRDRGSVEAISSGNQSGTPIRVR
ncbi:MAG: hypothetical protein IAG10_33440, partial [Planctomycetaceae bacterium]|nr:hypothetical protein [Planctomycetaceae bacterium]